MKISVVCKTKEWQVERLKEEAEKLSVGIDVFDITSADTLPSTVGDIVLWRSSSLGGGEARHRVMSALLDKTYLINRCLARLPQATGKSFQQEYIREKTKTIHCIPTFQFETKEAVAQALQEKILHLPFIIKPNKGSKGEGVFLIKNILDFNQLGRPLSELVFQNFIKNSGDYRVFVLGGRVLGVIKRTAKKGDFLNNISKGGTAEVVKDQKVLKTLRHIGTTVASVFDLTLCGVDVIYDEKEKKYFFLEVNTAPQWKGFQQATGINVAKEIILFCQRITKRKVNPTSTLVREEYVTQIHLLAEKKFHLLSRLFLWTKEPIYQETLGALKKNYIGENNEEHLTILKKLYAAVPEHGNFMVAKEARMEYFRKYPTLEPSLNLLFKNLFVAKLYGINLRPIIKNIVSDTALLDLKWALENDSPAIQILSTHAINYLYLLEFYLGSTASKTDPKKYLEIGSTYLDDRFELQIYFFTHCIIGASRFYSEKIKEADLHIYHKMLRKIELIITEHFQEISLDNKFEFLVCTRLCHFHSSIEDQILAEADQSLSPDGNFLIDTKNSKAAPDERNDFVSSEHRNVLYIMSQTPFRH
jgi:RimK family alpha-L-glutamate ligase